MPSLGGSALSNLVVGRYGTKVAPYLKDISYAYRYSGRKYGSPRWLLGEVTLYTPLLQRGKCGRKVTHSNLHRYGYLTRQL
jgi:hypothetical protein